MKLFLASLAISNTQAVELAKLVGKDQEDIKLALIENAADPDGERPDWAMQNRTMIQSHEFDVEIIDLREYRGKTLQLKDKLAAKDVIWCGGGSAGAIVAGPTLKHFDTADDPKDAPKLILDGLHFTDSVVVPHMDNAKFASIIHGINDRLKADNYKTVPLGDAQALIVDGDKEKVLS